MKMFLKIAPMEWKNASRDKRELEVAKEAGFEVLVIAKGDENGKYKEDVIEGFPVMHLPTKPFMLPSKLNFINRIVAFFQWSLYISKLDADVLSCHDLIALGIGYLSMVGKRHKKKTILVYDSHEFELERACKRSKWFRQVIYVLEKFLIKKADLNIMVSKNIADEVTRIYHLTKPPLVIRNIPHNWVLRPQVISNTRENICKILEVEDNGIILISHGMIFPNRGLERTLEVVAKIPDAIGVILGNGDKGYLSRLKAYAKDLGVEKRILFHKAVPLDELSNYIGAADVELFLAESTSKSYLWSLPNKFFESLQSLTPFVCGDFPLIKEILDKYKVGYSEDVKELDKIIDKIYMLYNDRELDMRLERAKQELCWENEKKSLLEIYRGYYEK